MSNILPITTTATFALLFTLRLTLAHAFHATLRLGFTSDNCNQTENCHFPRRCVYNSGGHIIPCSLATSTPACYCLSYPVTRCDGRPPSNSTTCPRGEICVRDLRPGRETDYPFCLSCNEAQKFRNYYSPLKDPTLSICPVRTHRGLTLDPCKHDSDCAAPRTCADRARSTSTKLVPCMTNSTKCFCHGGLASPLCDECKPCTQGERCFQRFNNTVQWCLSELSGLADPLYAPLNKTCAPTPRVTPSNTPSMAPTPSVSQSVAPSLPASPSVNAEQTSACVDVRHLDGLSHTDRVFANDILTEVLCDDHDSCATSGHMVVFRRRAMSMRRYCMVLQRQGDGDGCVTKMRWVNSPRTRRGRRVGSRTDGLEFTALAARYGSRAEEILLGVLVRAGM